ncbi:uncharacterized protein [Bemisia tabaci]|uniref:uncharacterized protein n=1 Tax=Bemisia tabaci TaxID=7038 RepID=UPI003B27EA78
MSETSGTSIVNIKMEPGIDGTGEKNFDLNNVTDLSQTCRACACVDTYFIPVFDGQGIEHDLGAKINQYLPIIVSKADELPTQLCYQCASLLVTWHEMFIGSLKAEENLRKLKLRLNAKNAYNVDDEGQGVESEELDSNPEFILGTEMEEEISRPLIVSAQPISKKKSEESVQNNHSDSDDSKDFQALYGINSEELPRNDPLNDVGVKFKVIEPLKLPDYSNFVVCKLCGECINTSQTPMTEHEKTSHGIKSKKSLVKSLSCVCEYCGKVFATQRRATYHRRHVHLQNTKDNGEPKEKICEVCGAVLQSSKKLREHRRNNHVTARNFQCVVCLMCFKLKETLVSHQKNAHNVFVGEKYQPSFHRQARPCTICGVELASNFSLRRHLYIKHGQKIDEKFSFKVKTFECDHCDRTFNNKISFLRHRDKVLGGQLEKKFKCEFCPRGFFCHTDFIRHCRTHKQAIS